MGIADGAHNFEIFARFDLKFDALITGAKLNFDSFKKHLGSGFEPYGDTAFDFRLRAAKQSGEREIFLLGLDIPESIFDPRAGHLVTPNGRKTTWNFRGGADFLAKNPGNEKSTDDKPCGVPGFGIVERTFRGGHFGPAGEAVSEEFNKNDGAVTGDTKTSFKGGFKTHLEFAQGDRFDPHGAPRKGLRGFL